VDITSDGNSSDVSEIFTSHFKISLLEVKEGIDSIFRDKSEVSFDIFLNTLFKSSSVILESNDSRFECVNIRAEVVFTSIIESLEFINESNNFSDSTSEVLVLKVLNSKFKVVEKVRNVSFSTFSDLFSLFLEVERGRESNEEINGVVGIVGGSQVKEEFVHSGDIVLEGNVSNVASGFTSTFKISRLNISSSFDTILDDFRHVLSKTLNNILIEGGSGLLIVVEDGLKVFEVGFDIVTGSVQLMEVADEINNFMDQAGHVTLFKVFNCFLKIFKEFRSFNIGTFNDAFSIFGEIESRAESNEEFFGVVSFVGEDKVILENEGIEFGGWVNVLVKGKLNNVAKVFSSFSGIFFLDRSSNINEVSDDLTAVLEDALSDVLFEFGRVLLVGSNGGFEGLKVRLDTRSACLVQEFKVVVNSLGVFDEQGDISAGEGLHEGLDVFEEGGCVGLRAFDDILGSSCEVESA